MAKKIIVALLFIILTVSASIQGVLIKKTSEELSSLGEQAVKEAYAGNMQKAAEIFEKLNAKWQEEKDMMEALLEHSESDKIATALKKTNEYLIQNDRTQFLAEAAALNYLMRHIYEIDRLSFENIL